MNTISPVEVFRLQSGGEGCRIIDVRTPGEYGAVHIDGASLMPLNRLDPRAAMSELGLGADGRLYVVCQSGARGAKACAKFQAAGFKNVVNIEGGTAAWAKAGLPVVRGASRVISLERQVRIGAGTLILLGAALGWLVHPLFYILCAFIGAGLVFSGISGFCGMAVVLAMLPWNRGGEGAQACCGR